MLVDVHCHLTDEKFDEDRDEVVARAGIIITSGTDKEDNREVLKLAKKYKNVKVALGFHPGYLIDKKEKDIEKEIEFISKQKIDAIGEIGLDFVYEQKEKQEKYFRMLLEVAKKKDLPVIIHSRLAERKCVEILEEMEMKKVVMHCFCG